MSTTNLQSMKKSEKEEFLSNDLIERLIRVEQKVSLKFGKNIPYQKTNYYLGLSSIQKSHFEKYLKNKKNKKWSVVGFLAFLFILTLFANLSFTGNAIRENFSGYSFNYFLIILLIFLICFFVLNHFSNKKRHKRLTSYENIIPNIISRKHNLYK